MPDSRAHRTTTIRKAEIHLFGGPYAVIDGKRIDVPPGSKRLVVLLALSARPLERRLVAGKLWPDGGEARAAGNLRSAIFRLRCAGIDVIDCGGRGVMQLRSAVLVDVQVISDWAARLIEGCPTSDDLAAIEWRMDPMDLDWSLDDDWAILERERVRQRLLHGVEALSRYLVQDGRCAEGVDAALAAVRIDPLRESAQRVLMEAYVAEGNLIEAFRTFDSYRHALKDELGVEPSPDLKSLLYAAAASSRTASGYRRPNRSS